MNLAKLKYEASKARLKLLSPIKETSNLYTPRVSEKKTVMVQRDKSMVIQTLPQEYPPRQLTEILQPKTKSCTQPRRRDDDVDHLVDEYLHYSKYRNAMPVQEESWDGRSTSTCPCCQKRNMESMQLKREGAIASDRPRIIPDGRDVYNTKDVRTSPRVERNVNVTAPVKNPSDWVKYQPMPNAQTYLSPEYNRPYVLQDFNENSQLEAQGAYVKTKIIHANARYKEAMDKLERTSKYLDPDRIEYNFT